MQLELDGGDPKPGSEVLAETLAGGDGADFLRVGPKVVTCPEDSVRIQLEMEPNDIVRRHPAGTTFCFEGGLHRLTQPVDVRDGDTFTGEVGGSQRSQSRGPIGARIAWIRRAVVPGGLGAHLNGNRASCGCPAMSDDGHDRSEYVLMTRYCDGLLTRTRSWRTRFTSACPTRCTSDEIPREPGWKWRTQPGLGGTAINVTVRMNVLEKFATPAGNDGVVH